MYGIVCMHVAAAALRGVRWAPYQLVGWALLLLAAHALAGLVELLERAMPPLRYARSLYPCADFVKHNAN